MLPNCHTDTGKKIQAPSFVQQSHLSWRCVYVQRAFIIVTGLRILWSILATVDPRTSTRTRTQEPRLKSWLEADGGSVTLVSCPLAPARPSYVLWNNIKLSVLCCYRITSSHRFILTVIAESWSPAQPSL